MMALLKRNISRDQSGATAIEFALTFPAALLLLIGIMEIGFSFFVGATVENAVLSASRLGVTGYSEEGLNRAEQILQAVEEGSYDTIDMDKVTLDTLVYESFDLIGDEEPYVDENESGSYDDGEPFTDVNGNGAWDADIGAAGLGDAGDIVLYRLSYSTRSMTGMFDPILGLITHEAAIAVRNEPF